MIITTVHKHSLQKGLLILAVLLVGLALLTYPQAVDGGINRGLSICYTVIIPSLFPFLVLTGFVTRSGIIRIIGKRMEKITRFLFGLPGECSGAILIGLVGGYPAGGAAVAELMRQNSISRRDAKRLLMFCVNAGPAFIISTVGAGLLNNTQIGIVLFAAHIVASLLIGIVGRFFRTSSVVESSYKPMESVPVSSALAESVNTACRSMLYMCGFVVLFTALQALADVSGLSQGIGNGLSVVFNLFGVSARDADCILPIITEVTGGCVAASTASQSRIWLLGMALGWGGLSVHCQLASTLHEYGVMGKTFWLGRALHALLGGGLSAIWLCFIPITQTTAQSLSGLSFNVTNTSIPAAITLLFMCVLLLFTNSRTGINHSAK